ncbi:MAG TPA: hypothetical protein VMF55_00635 [Solirubrobacterales bacterium]|nr:hypothetical protein [Solirubrobacterales bacterium]
MSATHPDHRGTPNRWLERAEAAPRAAGHRSTLPRAAIIELLAHQDCGLTAAQIEGGPPAGGRVPLRA